VGISIKITGVKKRLGITHALDGVSVELMSGISHGVIGPEGAGKTTLFRAIAGLYSLDSGKIEYFVDSKKVEFESIRNEIAYMPQSQSLYADLSISEHLDFYKNLYGISDELFEKKRGELLTVTRLEPFLNRLAGQLSGGMYKKLGLMCALLRAPKVLLLDEPTNGVDPISRREFWELLADLGHLDMNIIIATAYMDEAERCSLVHLLDRGKILMEGEPLQLISNEKVKSIDEIFLRKEESVVT
jgi:ABC-2 type transport system ATP-binding protein